MGKEKEYVGGSVHLEKGQVRKQEGPTKELEHHLTGDGKSFKKCRR